MKIALNVNKNCRSDTVIAALIYALISKSCDSVCELTHHVVPMTLSLDSIPLLLSLLNVK